VKESEKVNESIDSTWFIDRYLLYSKMVEKLY